MQIARNYLHSPRKLLSAPFLIHATKWQKIYIKKSKKHNLKFKKNVYKYSSVLMKYACASLYVCVRFLCPSLCLSATVHGSDKR